MPRDDRRRGHDVAAAREAFGVEAVHGDDGGEPQRAGRVEELQADFPEANIKLALMDEFKSLAAEHDVIFTAASTGVIIDKADLAAMAPANESVAGQRRLVDIAVPRNVDADCAEDDNTIVYNVDDLKELVELNKDKRERAADEASELLAHEQASFEAWRDSLETVPTIKRLRGKAENIPRGGAGEGGGEAGRRPDEETDEGGGGTQPRHREQALHGPMQALRSDGTDPAQVSQTLVNMHALETMFDLKNPHAPPSAGASERRASRERAPRRYTYSRRGESGSRARRGRRARADVLHSSRDARYLNDNVRD